ncbi:MAG: nicotinamide-nucleotide amidohydrolase family protein [Desulfomonilia bacterium]
MNAVLVITGSELISGFRQDILVMPFAARLKSKGVSLIEVRMISDSPRKLGLVILDLLGKTDIIFVTGGLGLTPDDTTLAAIRSLKEELGGRVRSEGYIQNMVGSAQGIDLLVEGTRIVFLPGVPKEALPMFTHVTDELRGELPETQDIAVFGLREVEIVEKLGSLADQCSFLPKDMEVTVVAPTHSADTVRTILGHYVLEGTDLITTVSDLLAHSGLTCATAESCTGGLIGHLITQVPGSSRYFLGSVVSYSNEMKAKILRVSEDELSRYGAVSESVAQSMLSGVLELTGADVGIATTGIAGPDGGSEEKPVGTVWVAVGQLGSTVARKFLFRFDRTGNKMLTAKVALFMLRTYIHDQNLHRTAHSR